MTQREAYIRGHIAWLEGADAHPGGVSGKRWLVDPHDCCKRCWDTAPDAWEFSEYARD